MHAKATRERKKAFLEAMELAIEKVSEENAILAGLLGNEAPSIMSIMTSKKNEQLRELYVQAKRARRRARPPKKTVCGRSG
jgi:hypothetical protein